MPKVNDTRKQKAAALLQRLERGPMFSTFKTELMDNSPEAQFKRWSQTWILPVLKELVPELRERKSKGENK